MKFLCVYKPAKAEGTAPTQADLERMGKFVEESFKAGWLLSTEGCLPSALGSRVRLTNGKFNVVDGPFTESKELIAGMAVIQASSREEAVKHTKEFLKVAGDGETEIRQLHEGMSAEDGGVRAEPRMAVTR